MLVPRCAFDRRRRRRRRHFCFLKNNSSHRNLHLNGDERMWLKTEIDAYPSKGSLTHSHTHARALGMCWRDASVWFIIQKETNMLDVSSTARACAHPRREWLNCVCFLRPKPQFYAENEDGGDRSRCVRSEAPCEEHTQNEANETEFNWIVYRECVLSSRIRSNMCDKHKSSGFVPSACVPHQFVFVCPYAQPTKMTIYICVFAVSVCFFSSFVFPVLHTRFVRFSVAFASKTHDICGYGVGVCCVCALARSTCMRRIKLLAVE